MTPYGEVANSQISPLSFPAYTSSQCGDLMPLHDRHCATHNPKIHRPSLYRCDPVLRQHFPCCITHRLSQDPILIRQTSADSTPWRLLGHSHTSAPNKASQGKSWWPSVLFPSVRYSLSEIAYTFQSKSQSRQGHRNRGREIFTHGMLGASPGIFWYQTCVLYTTTVREPALMVTNPSASGFT